MSHQNSHPFRQRGAVLIVGLMFLVLITLVAITALGSTVLQERMTSGQRNESLAFNGSESALRGGELSLWNSYIASDGRIHPAGTSMVEPLDAGAAAFRATLDWVAGTVYSLIDYDAIAATAGGAKLARDPNYHIEYLAGMSQNCLEAHCGDASRGVGVLGITDWFRVTARSTGGDARVLRVTESVYAMGR